MPNYSSAYEPERPEWMGGMEVPKPELGDAPVEATYVEKMQVIAAFLDEIFNGEKKSDERDTGFVLMVFPFGSKEGRCNYISNGADRDDVVRLMREQIKRFEAL